MAEVKANSPRWPTKHRAALALKVFMREISAKEAPRQHGLKVAEVELWREQFQQGAENALRSRPRNEEALKDEHIKRLQRKVGELVLDMDILKAAEKLRRGPPGPGMFEEGKECSPAFL